MIEPLGFNHSAFARIRTAAGRPRVTRRKAISGVLPTMASRAWPGSITTFDNPSCVSDNSLLHFPMPTGKQKRTPGQGHVIRTSRMRSPMPSFPPIRLGFQKRWAMGSAWDRNKVCNSFKSILIRVHGWILYEFIPLHVKPKTPAGNMPIRKDARGRIAAIEASGPLPPVSAKRAQPAGSGIIDAPARQRTTLPSSLPVPSCVFRQLARRRGPGPRRSDPAPS